MVLYAQPGASRSYSFRHQAQCAVAASQQRGSRTAIGAACGVAFFASGCGGWNDPLPESTSPLGQDSQQLSASQCDLDPDRSLVVHDAATLAGADFSLERTLEQIAKTSGGASTPAVDLLQSLLDGFRLSRASQPGGRVVPIDVRPGESALRAADLLDPRHADFMEPVALFNRFDLMPETAAHCGEHRIVYAKTNTSGGRFFLIFEAALPNPGSGVAGCQGVADFWASLSDSASFPTPASRAGALEEFFYEGLPGLGPVVSHQNYGIPFGQVRSNHFINRVTWQLREWRASFERAGQATFAPDTDKQTPLAELYDSSFVPPVGSPLRVPAGAFGVHRAAFQSDFLTNQVPLLAAPELAGGAANEAQLVNGFATAFPGQFDEFQSNAQGSSDIPARLAQSGFVEDVEGVVPPGVNATQLLNRAGSQTCGGCHQFSNSQDIGTTRGGATVRWPSSLGFVHVSESGALSPALQDFFLPDRLQILEGVCEQSQDSGDGEGACGSMSAEGVGSCRQRFGFRWTGTTCESVDGCTCRGQDCGELFSDVIECLSAHALCLLPSALGQRSLSADKPEADLAAADVARAVGEFRQSVALLQAEPGQAPTQREDSLLPALERMEISVQSARQAERKELGAFVKHRPSH